MRTVPIRFTLLLICLLLVPNASGAPAAEPAYLPLTASGEEAFPAEERAALVEALRDAGPAARAVILVYGFDTSPDEAERAYLPVARRLREAGEQRELPLVVAGLHWSSAPGSRVEWVPRALGHRLLSLIGLGGVIPDPYEEKIRLAREIGRGPLNALLVQLREQAPEHGVSVLAHSLGSEIVAHALAPALTGEREARAPEPAAWEPQLQLAVLAGADLDVSLLRSARPEGRRLLDRAELWWLTLPAKGQQDAVLAVRRLARGENALGNAGPTIHRDLARPLVARGGLYLDPGVPVAHRIEEYFEERRVGRIVEALAEWERPARGSGSVARLRHLATLPTDAPEVAAALADADLGLQLAAAWRVQQALQPERFLPDGLRWPANVRDVAAARALLNGKRAPASPAAPAGAG